MKKLKGLMAAVAFIGSLALCGCKDGNLFGGFRKEGSGDTTTLLSDAKAALARHEYNNAKSYYEAIIAKEPTNSQALYGAATATMGTAGLDFGTLLSNIVTAKQTAPSLHQAMQYSAVGVHQNSPLVSDLSILASIDLNNLSGSIDQIVCYLLKIRSGFADGKIKKDDISLLLGVGINCIIRSILRPLSENVIDLRQTADGKDFDIVILDANKLDDVCSNGVLQSSAADFAGGVQAIQEVINILRPSSGSTLSDLKPDLEAAFEKFKTKINNQAAANNADGDSTNDVPTSCLDFVNSFNVNTLTPPAKDPGDCLNKNVKPAH
jgi:hypothetical protein